MFFTYWMVFTDHMVFTCQMFFTDRVLDVISKHRLILGEAVSNSNCVYDSIITMSFQMSKEARLYHCFLSASGGSQKRAAFRVWGARTITFILTNSYEIQTIYLIIPLL